MRLPRLRARLFDVDPLIAEDRRYSRISFGRKELIDHIAASVELFPFVDQPEKQRRVPTVDSLVDFNTALPSLSDDPSDRAGVATPDHASHLATFEV